MSEFKNKSITTKGMELLSKALSGEIVEFTKIELGSGLFVGDIGEVTSLVSIKQSLPITKINRKGSQLILSTTLQTENIVQSFNWTEIGVYAKGNDGVEVLYMYGYTENSSYISKDSLNEKLIHVTVLVSNAAEVTATIDDSLVYLTAQALDKHNTDVHTHEDIRRDVNLLKGQLSNMDVSWKDVTGKPLTYPPTEHEHSEYISVKGEYANNIDELTAYGIYQLQGNISGTVPTGQTLATIGGSILNVTAFKSGSNVVVQELTVTNINAYSSYANRTYKRVRSSDGWSIWRELGGSSAMKTSVLMVTFKASSTNNIIDRTSTNGGYITINGTIQYCGNINIWVDGVQITNQNLSFFDAMINHHSSNYSQSFVPITIHYSNSIRVQHVSKYSYSDVCSLRIFIHENQ